MHLDKNKEDKMSEKFCLRWNDFETSISSAFKEIREEKDFFDVTLACDSDQIQAHKVILSACSPFFRNILKRNRHEHPLLYMKDISLTNLSCVLNFMYHGEVNVAQEDLNSFLAVAEELKVKGLTQKNDNETKTVKHTETSRPAAVSNGSRKYNSKSTSVAHAKTQVREDDDIQEVLPIKTEPTSVMEVDTGVVAMPQEQQEVYEETGEYGYEESGADNSSVTVGTDSGLAPLTVGTDVAADIILRRVRLPVRAGGLGIRAISWNSC